MADKKQKVSICIITYKSSDTIIELLDSILLQTYGSENIELVISDDKSSDNTIKIIESWLSEHKRNFSNIVFNINDENVGISKNFEKSLLLSSSKYIKSIAGDDILKKTALDLYMKSISERSTKILFSRVEKFLYENGEKMILDTVPSSLNDISSFNILNATTQFDRIFLKRKEASKLFIYAPSLFFSRDILSDILNAPKCKNLEDYPLWLFLTGVKGHQIRVLQETLVQYRVGSGVSFGHKKTLGNRINHLKDIIFIKQKYVNYLVPNKRINIYVSLTILYLKLLKYNILFFLKKAI